MKTPFFIYNIDRRTYTHSKKFDIAVTYDICINKFGKKHRTKL